MSAVLYPIAADAEAALSAPRGRAAREREAERLAGEPVSFVREFVGPLYRSEDLALDAYAGRLDDERPGSAQIILPEDRFCELKPVAERGRMPFTGKHTVWRLTVAYWRIGEGKGARPGLGQARKTRRDREAQALQRDDLDALARQPLQPLEPQKALDIGLFEVRLPENPSVVVADE